MTTGLNMNDCMPVAAAFSGVDLKAHPSTQKVMENFSENAVFIGRCFGGMVPFNVGKRVAEIGFYYLCEQSVERYIARSESFEEQADHIVWSFDSTQLRNSLLPAWLKGPQWYNIQGKAKLYFEKTDQGIKISKYESEVNQWTPCDPPAEAE